jgi:phosphoserine phosphatase RsbU/P
MTETLPFTRADVEFSQLRRLTEISRALTYTTSLEQVTRLTVERGAELLGARTAVLMLSDADGLLRVRGAHGVEPERIAQLQAPLGDDLFERLQSLLDAKDQCFVAVPLVVGGAVTGLLAVGLAQPSSSADEVVLSALADQAAVAVENARLAGEVREEMEERLRVSEEATGAKDRALATLAHDIRTPLAAIDGYCEIMQAEIYGSVNERQRETLGRVRLSGRHLLSLLDNVMEMARLSAGVLRLGSESVRLSAVAREAVYLVLPAAEARLQSLTLGDREDVVAVADHDRVRQILVNLIGNAVKFTPEAGTIVINVVGPPECSAGEIRVSDNGAGIPEGELSLIFEPYHRSSATAAAPGVGLGLAISHALAQQMGGDLTVTSELGVGSTFTVRLPLQPTDD